MLSAVFHCTPDRADKAAMSISHVRRNFYNIEIITVCTPPIADVVADLSDIVVEGRFIDDKYCASLMKNLGIYCCSRDRVITVDADVILRRDYIDTVIRAPSGCALYPVVHHPDDTQLDYASDSIFEDVLKVPHLVLDWVGAFSVACDKSALESVGGFDEGFVGYGYEDVDLVHRLNRHGVGTCKVFDSNKPIAVHQYHDRLSVNEQDNQSGETNRRLLYRNDDQKVIEVCNGRRRS